MFQKIKSERGIATQAMTPKIASRVSTKGYPLSPLGRSLLSSLDRLLG